MQGPSQAVTTHVPIFFFFGGGGGESCVLHMYGHLMISAITPLTSGVMRISSAQGRYD